MDRTLTDAVFAAAAQATHWTSTNLGPRTEISHGGYTWTVQLPAEGEGAARITGRYGHGGTELLDVPATPGQTIGIVEAAVPALRAQAEETGPGRWTVDEDGLVIGDHATEQDAKDQVRQLLLEGRANPQDLTVEWECMGGCEGACACPQMAYLRVAGCGRFGSAFAVSPAA